MGAHTKRAVSVGLALVLSGTPALLAACALLCVPATSHAAHGAVPQDSSPHAACCVVDRETLPAGHAHHGLPADSAESQVALGAATQMTSTDAACCPDGQRVAVAAATVTRADTGLGTATPIMTTAVVMARSPLPVARVGPLQRPLRSPARTPLVLRV